MQVGPAKSLGESETYFPTKKSAAFHKTIFFAALFSGPDEISTLDTKKNAILKMAFLLLDDDAPGAISKDMLPGEVVRVYWS